MLPPRLRSDRPAPLRALRRRALPALAVGSAAPALRAQSRIPAVPAVSLPADVQRDLASIPDEGTCLPGRHFPVSNDYRHDRLYPDLRDRGGVHAGVGSDQNYTMAAVAGAELLLLVDYDPLIPRVHRMYRALVSVSETPDALVARFAPEAQEESERVIAAELADDPRRDDVVRCCRGRRAWFERYLRTGRYRRGFQFVGDILVAGPPPLGADGLSHITAAQTSQAALSRVPARRRAPASTRAATAP